ncbi:MAG: aminomethyltransferase family protein, partial [Desulfobacteraceae bacterium]|nr:aminomethyltransferase family protein [Desulfobacteraceae bacterium]
HTFEIPNWFEHVAAEHQNARQKVVLIDQSSFCKFAVQGPGALAFLNRLSANQVDKPVGKVIYTQMCNHRGTIECDLTIARLTDDRFMLVVGTAFGQRAAWWLNHHLPADGSVAVQEMTSAYGVINVIGPRSRELLQKLTRADVSSEGLPFGTCKNLTVGHAPVISFRVTYVGELGYELYIPTEFAAHVYESLWEAGQDLGVKNAGYRTIASLHLEKGYADWGSELSPEYTPFDAGLGFCVALDKDDFIGKEALAKIKAEGPKWKLCSFTIDTGEPLMLQGSAPIIHQGEVLGVTTSSGYGHTVKKNICYGYIPAEKADPANGFEIESYNQIYTATLEPSRVLYDPERKKILM